METKICGQVFMCFLGHVAFRNYPGRASDNIVLDY